MNQYLILQASLDGDGEDTAVVSPSVPVTPGSTLLHAWDAPDDENSNHTAQGNGRS